MSEAAVFCYFFGLPTRIGIGAVAVAVVIQYLVPGSLLQFYIPSVTPHN
jgi:hypothetical protein